MKTPNTYALLDALSKSMSPAAIMLAGLQGAIAAEICKKRFDLHMNQKEFADYMGVSQSTVSNGRRARQTSRSIHFPKSLISFKSQCNARLSLLLRRTIIRGKSFVLTITDRANGTLNLPKSQSLKLWMTRMN